MDGCIYDVTEWAACQADNLQQLKPNSHNVQYHIVSSSVGLDGGRGKRRAPGQERKRSDPAA